MYLQDEDISNAAFDVLEEVCFDENSLDQLLQYNEKILFYNKEG